MTLVGKQILITRQRDKATLLADLLRVWGAMPVLLPTIEITPVTDPGPLDQALSNLKSYSWIIFTSTNAVEAVWERPAMQASGGFPPSLRVAAIGPETARYLTMRGVVPHFVPKSFVAEAILPGLGELQDCRVLLPLADIAKKTLPEAIQAAGGIPEVLTAYHTRPPKPDQSGLEALQRGLDVITFTSGSTVRNFVAMVEEFGLDPCQLPGSPVVACIGPKTARVAADLGLRVEVIPEHYTVIELVQALRAYFGDPLLTSEST